MSAVLILARPEDTHAVAISHVLATKYGAMSVIVDMTHYPERDKLSFISGQGASGITFRFDGRNYCATDFNTIWHRRPGTPTVPGEPGDSKMFALREADTFWWGLMAASDIRVVNNPENERRATRKAYQLAIAQRLGLQVPRTLMTNDPEQARDFLCGQYRPCIYKAFTQPRDRMLETRIVQAQDISRLCSLEFAPVIFQEFVPLGRDVRATIMGDRIFAAEVTVRRAEGRIDWRLDLSATWRPLRLSSDLERQLVALRAALGLEYGCVDLRESSDGQVYFLEINPSGQFLFVEVHTGQPLIDAFCELLLWPGAPREAQ